MCRRFQTGGVHTQLRTQVTNQLFLSLLYRRIRSIYYPTPEQGKSDVVSMDIILQPRENIQMEGTYDYSNFFRDLDGTKLYDYGISRLKLLYQVNPFLFFRVIGQYNDFRKEITTDFLASFTYIPGTAIYLGYGSIFDEVHFDGLEYVPANSFLEMQRGLFMKMSYLWRS